MKTEKSGFYSRRGRETPPSPKTSRQTLGPTNAWNKAAGVYNVVVSCLSLSRPTAFEADYTYTHTLVWKLRSQMHGLVLMLKNYKLFKMLTGCSNQGCWCRCKE